MSSDTKFKVVDKLEIAPNNDFVLVKVDSDDAEEVTSGGIIVPRGALQNKKTCTGIVVSAGPGRIDPSTKCLLPMTAVVGSRILFAAFIGYPIMIGFEGEHVIIKDYDIMAVVKEDAHWVDEVNATELILDSQRNVV